MIAKLRTLLWQVHNAAGDDFNGSGRSCVRYAQFTANPAAPTREHALRWDGPSRFTRGDFGS